MDQLKIITKKITSFSTNRFISGKLSKAILIKCKTHNIIMKTEQTRIVYAQWDRWTSYDLIKHPMITNDLILK